MEYKNKAKEQSNLYKIVDGPETPVERLGTFKARWNSEFITVFDDIISNFETHKYELIDAQSAEVRIF